MKRKTQTWLELAEGDLEFARDIIKAGKRPHYAVHFCHQAIEKVLKAVVQEHGDENPKRTHNFKILCEQTSLIPPPNIENFLQRLSPHYLASRYPEDLKEFHKIYTLEYTQKLFKETEEIFQWLKKYITSTK